MTRPAHREGGSSKNRVGRRKQPMESTEQLIAYVEVHATQLEKAAEDLKKMVQSLREAEEERK